MPIKDKYNKYVFSLEELKDIQDRYISGESEENLAKYYGVSSGNGPIRRLIKKYNWHQDPFLLKEKQKTFWTPEKIQRMNETRRKNNVQKYGRTDPQIKYTDKEILQRYDTFVQKIGLPSLKELYAIMGLDYSPHGGNHIKKANQLKLKYQIKKDSPERQVQDFLEKNNIKYIGHDRQILKPKELDFYLPEYQLAIEVNDLWTHNSSPFCAFGNPKPKKYHFEKSWSCRQNGIRLIHIWDYEWEDERKRPILENMILSACKKIPNRIYARNCDVKILPAIQLKDFFLENNIQGYRGAKIAVGLFYKNELVMAYSFGSCYFGKYQWEVIRGATKLNWQVIGGATKILSHFVKEYNPESLVYYIDFNYYSGLSPKSFKMDFVSSQEGCKNYFVKENIVKNRDPSKYQEIKKMYATGEIWPIYDAGTLTYAYKKS